MRYYERNKTMKTIETLLIFSLSPNISGICIYMMYPTCDEEKGSHNLKSEVKILDPHSKIWSEYAQVSQL